MVKRKSHQEIWSRILSFILSLKQMFLNRGQRARQRPHKLSQSRSYKWKKQVIAEHVGQWDRIHCVHCSLPFFSLSLFQIEERLINSSDRSGKWHFCVRNLVGCGILVGNKKKQAVFSKLNISSAFCVCVCFTNSHNFLDL